MSSFTINYNSLSAVRTHSADNDTRYYLNGVCFMPAKKLVAATDGHRLFVANALQDIDPACADFILDNASVDAILSAHKTTKKYNMAIEFTFSDGTVSVVTPIGTLQFKPIDGRFPDISRVIPDCASIPTTFEAGHYNWRYLHEADMALDIFTDSVKSKSRKNTVGSRAIIQRGRESAIMTASVTYNQDVLSALIVIMPTRAEAEAVYNTAMDDLRAINACFTA